MAEYNVTYNGLTLGPGTDFPVQSVEGIFDREVILNSPDLPRYHGTILGASYHGSREIILTVEVFGDPDGDFTPNRRLLMKAFQPQVSDELPLTFHLTGETAKRVNARIQGGAPQPVSVDTEAGIMVFALRLHASDPAIYEDTVTQTTLDPFTSSEGLSYPVLYPKIYGAGGTGGGVQVTNAGDWETWPTLTVNGPTSGTLTDPILENVTTGKAIELTAEGGVSMTSGQQLIIETHPSKRSIKFAGGASRYGKLSDGSEFWMLNPGVNEIRFRAFGSTTGATCDVEFRSAWI